MPNPGEPNLLKRPSSAKAWVLLTLCPLLVRAQTQPLAHPEQTQQAGLTSTIHGTITATGSGERTDEQRRAALFERYPTRGGQGATQLTLQPGPVTSRLSETTVVYLESPSLDSARYEPAAKHPMLDQRNLQFHPQVLPVLVGTTVDFPNRDNLFHNVFSYSHPKEFDLGRYPKDDSRSVTFDRPGVVRVYCDIHSHMNATILVLQNPYYATPDDNGRYQIPDVPGGKYRIVLWHGRNYIEGRWIEVGQGKSLEVNFTF